jgi:DNA topoisomerase-3
VDLEWARGRLFDQNAAEVAVEWSMYELHEYCCLLMDAQVFLQLIRSSDSRLHCEEIKASETRRTRPDPLNTVEFLKLASKVLGIGPQAAMRTAEHLYLSGIEYFYSAPK